MTDEGYFLGDDSRRRLEALEEWFDPWTRETLEATGVGPGWRCLEAGAGAGSIARWLADRVGPTGRVTAADLDVRHLDPSAYEVLRMDLRTDPLPEAAYDLVHLRFVLEHLPDREHVLQKLVRALKPGGWLVVEDTDASTWIPDPGASRPELNVFYRFTGAVLTLLRTRGADAMAGRRLPGEFLRADLEDVRAEGRVPMGVAGGSGAKVWTLTAELLRPSLEESGLLLPGDVDEFLALLWRPGFTWLDGAVIAARGRKAS